MQQNAGSCLHIQSVSLCIFNGKVSQLILRDIKDGWLPVRVIFVNGGSYVFVILSFWVYSKIINFLLFVWCKYPPCIGVFLLESSVGLVDIYCLNLVLSWNVLISPSMMIQSFVGHSSLGWYLCSLRVWMTSAQDLLAFIISGDKSGVILIGMPLYVTWSFSLTALIFFLCFVH